MKDKKQDKNTYKHIDKDERNEIKAMLEKDYSQADIARALGRSGDTITKSRWRAAFCIILSLL
ncbi:MAG: helix-turn-helix domain-containing protein [Candidatus Magasanikbacteria bacterium]